MLTFTNIGVLDPRAITTFGINVKENKNPIGHFGTGLKYAIAIVLRLGGKIIIETEDEAGEHRRYDFTAVKESVRGKEFSFVHMETSVDPEENSTSTPLGFTTELGKDWEPWMAYRELASNTLDEGGFVDADGFADTQLNAPRTEISIICPEVEAIHAEVDKFFLLTEPLWANDDLEIHPAREDGAVFYRGIRVAMAKTNTAVYTYNILHEEQLTEDRTIDLWTCSYRIAHAVALLDNQEIAEAIILARPGTYEASLSFDYVAAFSDEMREAIRLRVTNTELNRSAARRARYLYRENYVPTALPMTAAQRRKVAQVQELFAAFNIAVSWTDIRLGQMPPDEDDAIMVIDGVLWMGSATFDSDKWLVYVMANRWLSAPWAEFREERQLLAIMQQARPDLAVFQGEAAKETE